MQWLLLGVIVAALLLMSTRFPKTAFAILGVLGAAAAAVIFSTRDDAAFSRAQLPPQSVRIENAVVTPAYGNSYQFSARLVNTHDSILMKEASLSVTLLDCPAHAGAEDDANCTIIGQRDLRVNIQIPAGQARDISENVFFHDASPAGNARWRYRVTATRS